MSETKKKSPIVAVTLRHDQIDKLPKPDKSFAARLEKRTLSAWFQRAVDYYIAAGCPK